MIEMDKKLIIKALGEDELDESAIEPNFEVIGNIFIGIPQSQSCVFSLTQVSNGSFDIEIKGVLICPAVCTPVVAPKFVLLILTFEIYFLN